MIDETMLGEELESEMSATLLSRHRRSGALNV
jgi:hypothetical protein